jgi:hypothetical protein
MHPLFPAFLFGVLLLPQANAQTTNCLLFDGVDDHAAVPNTALNAIGVGDFTVEAWVRGTEAEQVEHPRIIAHSSSSFLFFFHGLWGGSQHKMLSLRMGGVNHLLINNGSYNGSILDDNCHHVAIAREDDTLHYFVDGISIGDVPVIPANPTVAGGAMLFIGNNDSGANFGFKGNISQVRIWDRARTGAEITADMALSIPGNTPELAGYWELNDGGQAVVDRTGTADGQLGSTSAVEVMDPSWVTDCCTVSGVGMVEPSTAVVFNLYPNPVSEVLWIAHGVDAIRLRITDALGRVVWRGTANGPGTTVEVAAWPEGVYGAALLTREGMRTIQFVKE